MAGGNRRARGSSPDPQLSLAAEGVGEDTWTVSQLSSAISGALAARFPDEVWVKGEIHNLRDRNRSPHTYFELVEQHAERSTTDATIDVALLARERDHIDAQMADVGGFALDNGIEVRIRGRVEYFGGRSRVQVRMTGIDAMFTVGVLGVRRARVRETLETEGLLRAQRALEPTLVPLRVGLATAADSAAAADVVRTLRSSGIGFEVITCDTRVQGPQAAPGIVRALTTLADARLDVVLLVRGGGSMTDLMAFDDERVARAIAGCPLPVITGIGHEIDQTIADDVAFTACNTPTAAAELVVRRVTRFVDRLDAAAGRIAERAGGIVEREATRLVAAQQRGDLGARRRLDVVGARLDGLVSRLSPSRLQRIASDQRQRVEHAAARLELDVGRHLGSSERRLDDAAARLMRRAERVVSTRRLHLEGLERQRRLLDPVTALARGWSITTDGAGRVVRSIHEVDGGERLTTRVADGEIHSTVDDPGP